MTHQTKVGIAVMVLSLSTGALGVLLMPYAYAMGWLLIGCAGFGLLLGAGITFWVDRSDEQPPG